MEERGTTAAHLSGKMFPHADMFALCETCNLSDLAPLGCAFQGKIRPSINRGFLPQPPLLLTKSKHSKADSQEKHHRASHHDWSVTSENQNKHSFQCCHSWIKSQELTRWQWHIIDNRNMRVKSNNYFFTSVISLTCARENGSWFTKNQLLVTAQTVI